MGVVWLCLLLQWLELACTVLSEVGAVLVVSRVRAGRTAHRAPFRLCEDTHAAGATKDSTTDNKRNMEETRNSGFLRRSGAQWHQSHDQGGQGHCQALTTVSGGLSLAIDGYTTLCVLREDSSYTLE